MQHLKSSLLQISRPGWSNIYSQCLNRLAPTMRYSSSSSPTNLLSSLKGELKSAMKAKDKARLDVLRAVLAEITNSSKTKSPIENDISLLALLRKRVNESKQAAKQAEDVSRHDLVEKEQAQIDILEEYAGTVKTLTDDEIRTKLQQLVERMKQDSDKINPGTIMMKSFQSEKGPFDGAVVEKSAVARIAKEFLN